MRIYTQFAPPDIFDILISFFGMLTVSYVWCVCYFDSVFFYIRRLDIFLKCSIFNFARKAVCNKTQKTIQIELLQAWGLFGIFDILIFWHFRILPFSYNLLTRKTWYKCVFIPCFPRLIFLIFWFFFWYVDSFLCLICLLFRFLEFFYRGRPDFCLKCSICCSSCLIFVSCWFVLS